MKIVVIGSTGTIGAAIVNALEPKHQVVRASRTGPVNADLNDPSSIDALFNSVGVVDAVVSCAASVALTAPQERNLNGNHPICFLTELFASMLP